MFMEVKKTLSLEEAKSNLDKQGLSVSKFAKINQVSPNLVQAILDGRVKCRIGKSHKIGVLLGLKEGEIITDQGSTLANPS